MQSEVPTDTTLNDSLVFPDVPRWPENQPCSALLGYRISLICLVSSTSEALKVITKEIAGRKS